MIEILTCHSRHEIKAFQKLPELIYQKNWRYGRPLPQPLNNLHDPRLNPLLHNGNHEFLLAMENGNLLMCALTGTDDVYNHFTGRQQGYISLFDGYDRPDVMKKLIERVVDFQLEQKNTCVVGPNPPDNSGFGMGVLVQGFEEMPSLFCPYNAPYYESLFQGAGFQVYKEHYGYSYREDEVDFAKYDRVSEWAKRRFGLRVELCDLNAGARSYRAIHAVLNEWDSRLTIEDTVAVFRPIRPYARKDFFFIAYQNDEPAGILLALPDGGLRRIGKIPQEAPHDAQQPGLRVVTLHVAKKFRGGGATAVLFSALMRAMKEHRVKWVQAATIDSENAASIAGARRAGGKLNRVYRQYRLSF